MSRNTFWVSGQSATLRGVGNKVFWAYPTIVVQDLPELIVLYMPAGVVGKDTDHKPTPAELLTPEKINIADCRWERTDVLFLIVPGDSFSTYLMWKTGTKKINCWYINLQEPIRRTRIGFDTMDHMLDIVIQPDMTECKWKDDDEFAEAQKVGVYSREKAREIWVEGERAVRLVTTERRSLYEEWRQWESDPEWGIPELSHLWDKINLEVPPLQNKL